ncbi:hypothetical protein PBRA_005807 [Plasmodiophora brassicae]|uniref:G-protein coupled receptors family 3 profile domain-containing protein n=1 Tax=Plasmodiophora brassicae TaxID=37360 RepID=A0A0G4IQR4_PLABS|nr:hypothetical protein PBRA_005807 [Plasmodiophora brassicae]
MVMLFIVILAAWQALLEVGVAHIIVGGPGGTLPEAVYKDAATLYTFVRPEVIVRYNAVGSGAAKAAYAAGTGTFACSDSPIAASMYASTPDLQMFPTIATAVVPIYNVPELTAPLVLTRPALAKIFMGVITRWNDSMIAQANPGQVLPNQPIAVVVRQDASGTTNVFSSALSSFDPSFKVHFGGADLVNWNVSNVIQGVGNPGVVANVLLTPYSIGYSVLYDAENVGVSIARIVNLAGRTVAPGIDGVSRAVAANDGDFDASMNINLLDASAPGAWPISTFTYLIFHTQLGSDCPLKDEALKFWLWFYTSPAVAATAGKYGFVTLSTGSLNTVLNKLYSSVKCNNVQLDAPPAPPTIVGAGVKVAQSIFNIFGHAFVESGPADVRSTYTLEYVKTVEYTGAIQQVLNGSIAFAVVPGATVNELPASDASQVLSVPFFSMATVFAYVLPPQTETLTLSFDVIRKILSGAICMWNDPALVALNPSMTLPNQAISVVMPLDPNHPSTVNLYGILYPNQPLQAFTPCHSLLEPTSPSVHAALLVKPYSLGYYELSQTASDNVARILFDGRSTPLSPSSSSLTNCTLYGSASPTCYQLRFPMHVVARQQYTSGASGAGCPDGQRVARTLGWLFNPSISDAPITQMNLGAYRLANTTADSPAAQITCDGVSILAPPVVAVSNVFQRLPVPGGISAAVIAIMAVGLVLAVGVLTFQYHYRSLPYIQMSSPLFNSIIALGAALGFVAPAITAYPARDDPAFGLQCNFQMVLFCIAFTLAYGGLFVKTWRVYKIFVLLRLKTVIVTNVMLLRHLALLLLVDVVVLGAWMIMDPMSMALQDGQPYADPAAPASRMITPQEAFCNSRHRSSFIFVLVVYKGAILIMGSWVSFQTSSVEIQALNDSKQIGMCIYSALLIAILTMPMITFSNAPPAVTLLATTLAAFFTLASTLGILFIPKLIVVRSGESETHTISKNRDKLTSTGMGATRETPTGPATPSRPPASPIRPSHDSPQFWWHRKYRVADIGQVRQRQWPDRAASHKASEGSRFATMRLSATILVVVCDLLRQAAIAQIIVTGDGGTLPASVYTDAATLYTFVRRDVAVLYNAVGSGTAKAAYAAGTGVFGCSDSPISDSMYSSYPDLQMFPTIATAVVPIYNVPELTKPLVLTRSALAKIFMGVITWWNDSMIAQTNPGQTLPRQPITVVVRQDSSGTTNVFSTALSSFDASFKAHFGGADLVSWNVTNTIKGVGNPGVVANVLMTPHTIGYSVLYDAQYVGVSIAHMVNLAGMTVAPGNDGVMRAVEATDGVFDARMNVNVLDASAPGAWPITTFTYLIFHTQIGTDCPLKDEALKFWLWFYTSPAVAATAEKYGFVTLSTGSLSTVLNKLYTSVKCNNVQLEWPPVPPTIVGAGVQVAQSIFNIFGHAFAETGPADIRGTYSLEYVKQPDYMGAIQQVLNGSIAFAVVPGATVRKLSASDAGQIVSVPYFSMATIFAYALPSQTKTLTLSVDSIRNILKGTICVWNDPALVALNPSMTLPNQAISVVMPLDPSHPSTVNLYGILYPNQPLQAFTPCHFSLASTSASAQAALLVKPYSLGYFEMEQTTADTYASVLFEGHSTPVAPSSSSLTNCSLYGPTSATCYQLRFPMHVVARQQYTSGASGAGCPDGQRVARTLGWLFNPSISEAPITQMNLGSYQFTNSTSESPAAQITCDGVSILAPPVVTITNVVQRLTISPGISATVIAIMVIGLVASIGVVAFQYHYRALPYIQMSSPLFNSIIALGAALGVVAPAVTAYPAMSDPAFAFQCNFQMILLCVAFTLTYGGLFVKTWRVYKIFVLLRLKSVIVTNMMLLRQLAMLLFVDVVLLGTWMIKEPMTMALETHPTYVDPAAPTTRTITPQQAYCYSPNRSSFVIAVIAYKGAILIMGSWISLQTSSVEIEALNDSKQIGLCIYSSSLIAILTIPLISFINAQPSITLLATTLAVFILLSSTLAILFIPKLIVVKSGKSQTQTITKNKDATPTEKTTTRDTVAHPVGRPATGQSRAPNLNTSALRNVSGGSVAIM